MLRESVLGRYATALNAMPRAHRAELPRSPLLFDPGERWEYGTSIDWVGRIVETVSEQRLDAYFHEHIFEPLGMPDTGFFTAAPDRLPTSYSSRNGLSVFDDPADSAYAKPPPFPAGYLPPEVAVGSFALYQPNSVGVGTVVLDVTIDKYGAVKKTDVIRDVPSLTPEAIAAVKRWTINAATFNGKAIASKLVVAYVFRSPTMTTR